MKSINIYTLAILSVICYSQTSELEANPKFEKSYHLFLKKYTNKSGVYYSKLKNNADLENLVSNLISLEVPTQTNARLAYWLNAYNLMTIKLIADNYPVDSIVDLHLFGSVYIGYIFNQTIWQKWHFKLHKKNYTLDSIEHQIIRPEFQDFRIHAALVCAAVSCPPLRREPYSEKKVQAQLNQQMKEWLADSKNNYYGTKSNTMFLSSIFKWFDEDFTSKEKNLLKAIFPYLPEPIKKHINYKTKIKYLDYDWALNDAK